MKGLMLVALTHLLLVLLSFLLLPRCPFGLLIGIQVRPGLGHKVSGLGDLRRREEDLVEPPPAIRTLVYVATAGGVGGGNSRLCDVGCSSLSNRQFALDSLFPLLELLGNFLGFLGKALG